MGVRSPDRAKTGSGLQIARSRGLTPLGVAVVSLLPVLGVFTTHRVFFVRDLGFFFWSRNLWLRHTLHAGLPPWWDPHVASGQPAIADALNQLLMPITLAIRLLPSDVVSFNLWVALPLPIAAVGTFGFLRRRVSHGPAALGALIFGLSGPVVSMLNAPNLSWSVAFIPWVLWACDAAAAGVRPSGRAIWRPDPGFARSGDLTPGRGVAVVALAVALQALSGEPVTLASTALIGIASALATYGIRAAVLTIGGFAAGAGLAAGQLLPMTAAAAAAHRGVLQTPDFWSLHPVSLWEVIAPRVFGDYYQAFLSELPWMAALNFGRDPFFYSIYLGPIVLLLACLALAARPRRTALWGALSLLFLIAALGGYTPAYPLARRLVPMLLYFRFPVKYVVVAAFAIAVLAADGFEALMDGVPGLPPSPTFRRPATASRGGGIRARITVIIAAIVGVAGLTTAVVFIASPSTMTRAAYALAASTHLQDPAAGAAFLARDAPVLLARAAVLLLGGCALAALMIRGGSSGRLAAALLAAAVCGDLVVTNGGLNPTADVSRFAPPAWYTAIAGRARLYVGGRVRGFMNAADPDASHDWHIPPERSAVLGRMELNAELPMAPSGWGVREALSYDLPLLWPSEYERTVRRFEQADAGERDAFLRRTDTRWCVVRDSEPRPWRPIADVPDWSMRVYDCHPDATRVFIATLIQIARDPADEAWERDALFDPSLPDTVARMPRMPAFAPAALRRDEAESAGRNSSSQTAIIVRATPSEVVVDASMPSAGVLVLRDTFEASWRADVDGEPADMVPANLLYRAVALAPGRHTVRFTYRPRAFLDGLMIAGLTAMGLLLAGRGVRRARSGRRAEHGFTLIELMIVIAIVGILVAVAFGEYRRTRAKGDEAVALQSLAAITTAQWQFAMTCGHLHYAASLAGLGQPSPVSGNGFLSPDLTAGDAIAKSGYTIHFTAKPRDDTNTVGCNGAALADGFAATADPDKPGTTGTMYFGVNTDRVIYADPEKTFTGNMPNAGAPPHGAEVK